MPLTLFGCVSPFTIRTDSVVVQLCALIRSETAFALISHLLLLLLVFRVWFHRHFCDLEVAIMIISAYYTAVCMWLPVQVKWFYTNVEECTRLSLSTTLAGNPNLKATTKLYRPLVYL